MQLPVIWPERRGQNFECRACTRCCRELIVHLTPADRDKIDRQNWSGRLGAEPYISHRGGYVLRHKPGGGCVFLMDDGRCRIHAEYGATEKPLACQLYPFTLEHGAGGLRVGIRFDCPTTATNAGPPIATFKADVKRLASALQDQRVIDPARQVQSIEVAGGVRVVEQFESHLLRWMRNDANAMDVRLAGLAGLEATLRRARLGRLGPEGAGELVLMLAGSMGELVPEASVASGNSGERALRLFRQAVFSHTEQVTFDQLMLPLWPAMKLRLNQLGRARQMSSGSGRTPPLRGVDAEVEFSQIERVVPDASYSAHERAGLLVRYVSARFEGGSVYGPGYYGWSIVDGLAALLLSVPAMGWLARCVAAAAGRQTFVAADLERAMAIVDRTAGRAPELGSKSALLRVRYLSEDHRLLRLVRHYRIAE